MPRVGLSLVVLVLLLGAPRSSRAAWDTPFWGAPGLEFFRQQQTGNAGTVYCAVEQPHKGPLWFGTEKGLLSFDGKTWRAFPGATEISALAFDAGGSRLWFGALCDLGFADLMRDGNTRFTSLREKLPFPAAELRVVWACLPTRDGATFVAEDRVLHWDGANFRVWHYPTTVRVCPIFFEGKLWFHHVATGLYRIGEDGPEKIAEPAQLPKSALLWLGRENGELIGASNHGVWTIAATPRGLSPDELNAFTTEHRLVGVAELGHGFRSICTLTGGLAIVDRHLRIVRRIGADDGLRGTLFGQYVDRDGALWAFRDDSLVRCDTRNATAQVRLDEASRPMLVRAMKTGPGDSVWIGAQNRLYRATSAHDGRLEISELPGVPLRELQVVCPSADGVLLGGFGGIVFRGESGIEPIFDSSSRPTVLIAPLRQPNRWLASLADSWVELTRTTAGQWLARPHPKMPVASSAVEDADGHLWTASPVLGVQKWKWQDGRLVSVDRPTEFDAKEPAATFVVGRASDILVVADSKAYRTRGANAPEFLCEIPGIVTACALSPDQSRLYVAFRRAALVPADYTESVGVVSLDPAGASARWRDFVVPHLASIGSITQLAVTAIGGADTLWVGGTEGLMQARPAELSEWSAPATPWITAVDPRGSGMTLGFAEATQLRLAAPELTLRPALRFQTKFGQRDGAWSAPTDRTTFDFSDLREGAYSFVARAVNPAGQVSEPAHFTFRILPPWYRSPWAYAAYAAALGWSMFGAARYRERRVRARNLELERLVRERTAELEKANAAKDEFLASMSHEIRNPMNGVVGLSAAIDISPLDEEGRYRFGLLRHCASHLASLLEDILDFSKLQAGNLELDPQPFSPVELLEAVSAITAPVSAAAGVKVEFALGPSVPPRLVGDARRIRQVLLNYVGNAIKYAPHGTTEVTAWSRPIDSRRVTLTFAVSDEGPGIPVEEHEQIFEKFERGAGARSSRIPGTGMGLAVCRRLAEKMGGRAWVESAPGKGSTFYLSLELPIATSAPARSPERTLAALPKRALVVDDEEYNVVALSALLERRGFTVHSALDGDTALRCVVEHKPDVIFLDYDMPDTTGPQLARRIREVLRPLGRHPLVIATTAYSTVTKRDECLAAGMDGFLGKPVAEDRLRTALEEAIQRRSPASARHLITPDAQIFDPLENLQTLARQHARTLETELAGFNAEALAEFAELRDAIAARDVNRSARGAHKISGRFGFLHAAAPMRRALSLEDVCRRGAWEEAQRRLDELAQDWAALRDSLSRLTCASAE